MLDLAGIQKIHDYIHESFPAMKGRVAVRTFNPDCFVGVEEFQAKARDMVSKDILAQIPESIRKKAESTLNKVFYPEPPGDAFLLAVATARKPSAYAVVPTMETGRMKADFFYVTQYSDEFTGQQRIEVMSGCDSRSGLNLPENFLNVSDVSSAGHEYGHCLHEYGVIPKKPSREREEAMYDVLGAATALHVMGPQALPGLQWEALARVYASLNPDRSIDQENYDVTGLVLEQALQKPDVLARMTAVESLDYAESIFMKTSQHHSSYIRARARLETVLNARPNFGI